MDNLRARRARGPPARGRAARRARGARGETDNPRNPYRDRANCVCGSSISHITLTN